MNAKDPEEELRVVSRRSFLWAGLAVAATYGGIELLAGTIQIRGVPAPLRRTLDANAELAIAAFDRDRLAPTYPASSADAQARLNSWIGVHDEHVKPENEYLIAVVLHGKVVAMPLLDVLALPKHELTMDLHCIEGWTTRVTWGGARFIDFARRMFANVPDLERNLSALPRFVGLSTPSGEYSVSLDVQSAMHPQTLLCYEMNGEPLTMEHGAPLRLVIPVKYGIKNIKQIGRIEFTDEMPSDYWAERGYDWYAGL